jgi:hypothetical protein
MWFLFTAPIELLPNDEIHVEFTTHDNVRRIFSDTLGLGFPGNLYETGCREHLANSLISDNTLACWIIRGDGNTRRPTIVKIVISKTITAG